MARFKQGNNVQSVLVPIALESQLIPGTFEYELNEIVGRELDLDFLDDRYKNDLTGAPAFDPRILLKIVLFGYSRGLYSSRPIAEACRKNVTFMVLSEFQEPDFTTIADFVSRLKDQVPVIFGKILHLCAKRELIGGEKLAVDGCKIPSNAAKEWSGTLRDLENKERKFQHRAEELLERHRLADKDEERTRLLKASRKLSAKAARIDNFLKGAKPRKGARGDEKQSNVTDNESAKMKSSQGMIQGYNGIALVDANHQVIVQAEAFGTGPEHDLLIPVLELGAKNLAGAGVREGLSDVVVLADNGYYKEQNLVYLEENRINGYIPDQNYRKRDARFKTMGRHRGRLTDKTLYQRYQENRPGLFTIQDFKHDPQEDHYICPDGKILSRWGNPAIISPGGNDYLTQRYGALKGDCRACSLRNKCIRNTNTRSRTLNITIQKQTPAASLSENMKKKMDTPEARHIYSMRMQIVEPVFANITVHKRLNRFTLRSKAKVDIQWKLYAIVHNIGKLANATRQLA